ncbi:MAG TPA: Gfo/Idh/MocA family oxidoreductase [Coriobacteriia bacterium]
MGKLRGAVIGAGNMGRHHVRILGHMEAVDLAGVVDADVARAAAHATPVGAKAYTDIAELPDIDVAVVAVPTPAHSIVAQALMERGVSVLIEKPMASTPAEARALVDTAVRQGVVLAVGHVERFNPAIRALAAMVKDPLLMQFERLSPYTPRIRESIVFDLMVHDLDLACLMAGGYPDRVETVGMRVYSDTLDIASAVLSFPSGCVASLQASRATQDKVRRIAISERDRFLLADSIRQDVSIKQETTGTYEEDGVYRQSSVVEIPYLDRRAEPLALELANFVAAVRGEEPASVDAEAGARIVELAHQVEDMASSR